MSTNDPGDEDRDNPPKRFPPITVKMIKRWIAQWKADHGAFPGQTPSNPD